MTRINEIKQWMDKNRIQQLTKMVRESEDAHLTDEGRFRKHAFELLDALEERPNDPSSPTAPTETPPLKQEADGAVRCSAWLGVRGEMQKGAYLYGAKPIPKPLDNSEIIKINL